MKRVARLVVLGIITLMVIMRAPASAQGLATIAGVVKDPSGALLPGVTVEAASPALIEKVRTASTDGQGAYKIIDLRPGTYTVTFTLSGFNTVKQDSLELPANFTATINAELKLGAVSETITVRSEVPLVDVQRATQVQAMTAENIATIPTGKTYASMAVLVPAVTFSPGRQDVGGADGNNQIDFISAHGSIAGDATLLFDGLRIGNMVTTGDRTSLQQSPLLFEQLTVQYSGNSGESASSAPQVDSVPKSGGNAFHGTYYTDFANSDLQSSNLTSRITSLSIPGQVATSRIYTLRDFNGAVGGPIVRDRVWFYTNARYFTNGQYVPNMFYAMDPASPVRVADTARQAFDNFHTRDNSLRLTIQATSKQKVSLFYVNQEKCNCHLFVNGTTSPDASSRAIFPVNLFQATWSYVATSRVLLQAGISPSVTPWTTPPQAESTQPAISDTGFLYRSPTNLNPFAGFHNNVRQTSSRASVSYVTGSHNAKFGWDMLRGVDKRSNDAVQNGITYVFVNGQPSLVFIHAPLSPGPTYRLDYAMGFYGQDQWTVRRLTVNAAIRLDMQRESVDALTIGPSQWAPTRNRSFAAQHDVPNWKDLNPRLGASYDLTGDGKTALKVSAARGVRQETTGTAVSVSPIGAFAGIATSTSRPWSDINRNFAPDCNLAEAAPNGECGPWLNATFANPNNVAVAGSQLDPKYVHGWGKRPYDWEFSGSVQRQLTDRVSANIGYFRRIFGNFVITDNLSLQPGDFSKYQVLVPNDSRLPGAGSEIRTAYDANRLVPAQNFVTTTSNLGLNQIQHWNGVDVTVDARTRNGLRVQGGVSTGKTTTDNCDVIAALPEANTVVVANVPNQVPIEYCHNATPFLTYVKGLAAYELPWAGVRISAALQNIPVTPTATTALGGISATVSFPTTTPFSAGLPSIASQLGRPFNGGATANVNVITPNTMYPDRFTQLDLKFAKSVKVQKTNFQFAVDMFNALNSDAILNQNYAYGSSTVISPQGTWLRPTQVLQGRYFKLGARLDF